LLSGSLMDYGLPRADLVPSFTTRIAEVLSPTNPLGIKAGGEGGTTAAPAVVVSAIVDALRDFGVRDVKMPATPHLIWTLIRDAKMAAGPAGSCSVTSTSTSFVSDDAMEVPY
jgi:aerobic carbon-monoxide dehydrogenase large subunit